MGMIEGKLAATPLQHQPGDAQERRQITHTVPYICAFRYAGEEVPEAEVKVETHRMKIKAMNHTFLAPVAEASKTILSCWIPLRCRDQALLRMAPRAVCVSLCVCVHMSVSVVCGPPGTIDIVALQMFSDISS